MAALEVHTSVCWPFIARHSVVNLQAVQVAVVGAVMEHRFHSR